MGCSFSGLNALYDAVNGGGDVWINENRFKIVRQLGEGGFAFVFLVKEVVTDASAATGGLSNKLKDPSFLSAIITRSKMFTFEESIIRSATSPVSFQAAYNNKHSAFDHFYNNLPISRAQNQVPSYTNYKFSSNNNNVVGSSSFPSIRGGGGGVSSTSMNTTEVMAFHSSTKWRTYFEASKQSNKLVVMFFTATWCRPCRSMEPIIKELGAKYPNVDLVKIDVDELFNVSREFKVQTMPTFVFMKNGKEIDRVSGAKKEDLQRKVENHGA